ncbi:T9SS type A sorting domain-containing protein [Candidatus Poribacteria bacterium]|nr:T9SS type A sorting domain-containing protein [Candidatus Poribacteria bacterium]
MKKVSSKSILKILLLTLLFTVITYSQVYSRSLYFSDFKRIAGNGIGDSGNSYGWSSAWFNGKFYVGTCRHIFELSGAISQGQSPGGNNKVIIPETFQELLALDLRAEVWEYTPSTKQWRLAYKSETIDLEIGPPFINPPDNPEVFALPLDHGYRDMVVHDGALYIGNSPLGFGGFTEIGLAARILRTTDGITFTPMEIIFDWDVIPDPGGYISSYRALVSHNGKLYTASAEGGVPVIFEGTVAGDTITFRPASEVAFGNLDNVGIFDMAVLRNYLYVGTFNFNGYEVWRAKTTGVRPYQWEPIITGGAGRGQQIPLGMTLQPFKGKMYVGEGNPAPGTYPGVTRIWPNGYWQVVCGDKVDTDQGRKWPISGKEGGFGNLFAGYVWAMEEHEGWLYVAVLDSTSVYLPMDIAALQQLIDIGELPPVIIELLENYLMPSIWANQGGFDLWKSWNGWKWYQVTQTGFGNPLNYGARTMVSSPVGLFITTGNPFTQGDLEFGTDSDGGTEVWLGRPYFRIFMEDPPDLIPAHGSKAAPAAQTKTTLEFAALDSYPNPANPEVWIPYQLPQAGEVSIDIHSVNGQLIKTIKLGSQEPGVYVTKDKAARWDGTNETGERVASGVYFYTLKAGEFAATKKITIAK